MTLNAVEFMRRFLLPCLPRGFVRIRQFGFLANRARKAKLALCRCLLNARASVTNPSMLTGPTLIPRARNRSRIPALSANSAA